MEGNYKRAVSGSTDDPYLKSFGDGVIEIAQARRGRLPAWPLRRPSGNDRRALQRLLVDYGGVLTTDLFDSFRAFCEVEGLEPEAIGQSFRRDPSCRELLIGLETGKLDEEEFEVRFAEILGVSAPGADRAADGRLEARRGDGRGGRERPPPGHPHRPDLELVGHAPLRPRAARRAVRRGRDLRRGRDPQAGTGDLRARARGRSGSTPANACSSTTCRSTSSPPPSSGWRPSTTPRRRTRSPSSSGCSASRSGDGSPRESAAVRAGAAGLAALAARGLRLIQRLAGAGPHPGERDLRARERPHRPDRHARQRDRRRWRSSDSGVSSLKPELTQLKRLSVSGDAADVWNDRDADAVPAARPRSRRPPRRFAAGADPAQAYKSLQQTLAPLETQANGAWQALQIPACQSQ